MIDFAAEKPATAATDPLDVLHRGDESGDAGRMLSQLVHESNDDVGREGVDAVVVVAKLRDRRRAFFAVIDNEAAVVRWFKDSFDNPEVECVSIRR